MQPMNPVPGSLSVAPFDIRPAEQPARKPKPRVVRVAHWPLTDADKAALDAADAKRLAKNAKRLAQRDAVNQEG